MTRLAFQLPQKTVPIVGTDIAFPVRRVYCVGRNYVAHIREMKEGDERDPPFFFQKPADAVMAPESIVPYPPSTDDFQFEVELVVAIGAAASAASKEDALACIFGYAVGVDLTRRDCQRQAFKNGLPWEIGKAFDHSAPCGPIHPVEQCGHLFSGAIALSVNNQQKQHGDLAQMIWNPSEIIANLSRCCRLEAGDLIMTGTPAGVGALVPGDRVVAEIEGLAPLTFAIGARKD